MRRNSICGNCHEKTLHDWLETKPSPVYLSGLLFQSMPPQCCEMVSQDKHSTLRDIDGGLRIKRLHMHNSTVGLTPQHRQGHTASGTELIKQIRISNIMERWYFELTRVGLKTRIWLKRYSYHPLKLYFFMACQMTFLHLRLAVLKKGYTFKSLQNTKPKPTDIVKLEITLQKLMDGG